jgi:hypothetical protein
MSIRLQGQLLLAGAIGAILASGLIFLLPGPEGPTGIGSLATNVVFVLSGVFLLVGLPAFYRAQAKQIGILGLAGMVLLWVAAILLFLVLSFVQILDIAVPGSIPHPGGDGPPPLAIIPLILGVVLTVIGGVIAGITTIRAHVLRASIGWVILISSVLLLLSAPVGGRGLLGVILTSTCLGLFYAGLAWAGATLSFRGKPTQVSESSVQHT